ncbi:MAG: quinone oxidoreductase family protein [Marmoricola sp.]
MASSSARVVLAPRYGGPEVLEIVAQPLAEPAAGEVVLEVRAAGVNPADVKSYDGTFGTDPAALPKRLGYEASGVVTAVGAEAVGPVGPVQVGDEVIAFRVNGAYADVLVVPAKAVVPKPAELAWEPAAGLMLTGATAVHALTATAVGERDTVLVHGGSGGVGRMAVQLAALRGARVIATASPRQHDELRALGAEPVAYGDGLEDRVRALAPGGIDAALDLVGTDEALDVSLALVADRQRIATIANFDRGPAEGIRVLGGGPGADPGNEVRDAARPELARLAGEGRLRVDVAATLPLADVAEAHRLVTSGHAGGKVVLVP